MRAEDRDRNDGPSGFEREPAGSWLGRCRQLPGPRPGALAIHHHRATAIENPECSGKRLFVLVSAADWKYAAMAVDPAHRAGTEQLGLSHELDAALNKGCREEVIHVR